MRKYEETHQWLKFHIDLSKNTPTFLWIMLGECQSKCEHIAGVPLRPEIARHLNQLYIAKGVLATTAIEGNTLSEKEVVEHLEGKLQLPSSKEYLKQEIDNILNGCNTIVEEIREKGYAELNFARIEQLNAIVLEKLQLDKDVVPGAMREHEVTVARYKGAPAQDCKFLLQRLVEWLESETFNPPKKQLKIVYSIIKAIVAHLYLAWIHPFGDGNGRTARIIEFLILISSGVPMPAAHLLSNHYNQTRSEYYKQLDYASKSGGDISAFLNYATQGLLDGLKSQLEVIRFQQWEVAWRNFVHEEFQDKQSPSDIRKRHLVLDLSKQNKPISIEKLIEISPRVAKAYSNKTRKTLSRDLNELIKMDLIRKETEGYRARMELILAFLPLTANEEKASKK